MRRHHCSKIHELDRNHLLLIHEQWNLRQQRRDHDQHEVDLLGLLKQIQFVLSLHYRRCCDRTSLAIQERYLTLDGKFLG